MGVQSIARGIGLMADLGVVPASTSTLEFNMPVKIDGATTPAAGIVKGSRTKKVGGRPKVGSAAGWVIGAAANVPALGTVAASQTSGTFVVPIEGLENGDI